MLVSGAGLGGFEGALGGNGDGEVKGFGLLIGASFRGDGFIIPYKTRKWGKYDGEFEKILFFLIGGAWGWHRPP